MEQTYVMSQSFQITLYFYRNIEKYIHSLTGQMAKSFQNFFHFSYNLYSSIFFVWLTYILVHMQSCWKYFENIVPDKKPNFSERR